MTDPEGERVLIGDTFSPNDLDEVVERNLMALTVNAIEKPFEIWYEWTSEPLGDFPCRFTPPSTGVVRRYLCRLALDHQIVDITVLATVVRSGWQLREVLTDGAAFKAGRRGHLSHRRNHP